LLRHGESDGCAWDGWHHGCFRAWVLRGATMRCPAPAAAAHHALRRAHGSCPQTASACWPAATANHAMHRVFTLSSRRKADDSGGRKHETSLGIWTCQHALPVRAIGMDADLEVGGSKEDHKHGPLHAWLPHPLRRRRGRLHLSTAGATPILAIA
jgi:hypothetical protein